MVDLMLDDLGRPASEIPDVGLHLTILPLNLNGAVPPGPALPLQRQATFLGQVQPLAVDDDRVEHLAGCAVVVKHTMIALLTPIILAAMPTQPSSCALSVSSRSSATAMSPASAGSAFCAKKTVSVIRGRTIGKNLLLILYK